MDKARLGEDKWNSWIGIRMQRPPARKEEERPVQFACHVQKYGELKRKSVQFFAGLEVLFSLIKPYLTIHLFTDKIAGLGCW